MISLLKTPRVVNEMSAETLHTSFDWVSANFDHHFFENHTILVQPDRDHFPDRADNERDMALALCSRILNYCGLAHWPFAVIEPARFIPSQPPLLELDTDKRLNERIQNKAPNSQSAEVSLQGTGAHQLNISYSPAMMKKPMDLVGTMSTFIAQHYLFQAKKTLPAGPESFNAMAEILAVYMGFGVFIANSAYTFRGSCARCYDPRANRTAALSEDEAIYALAIFCHNKNIPNKQVTPTLKSYLRSTFKKARKQVLEHSNTREASRAALGHQNFKP